MKQLPVLLIIWGLALLSCAHAPQGPIGNTDPKGRWHRDGDGYVTSGISPYEYHSAPLRRVGEAYVLESNAPSQELHDPLEDLPEFKRIFAYANREAGKRTAKYRGQLGAIHAYWSEKKKILREQFRIDWKSPAELNPMTSYD